LAFALHALCGHVLSVCAGGRRIELLSLAFLAGSNGGVVSFRQRCCERNASSNGV